MLPLSYCALMWSLDIPIIWAITICTKYSSNSSRASNNTYRHMPRSRIAIDSGRNHSYHYIYHRMPLVELFILHFGFMNARTFINWKLSSISYQNLKYFIIWWKFSTVNVRKMRAICNFSSSFEFRPLAHGLSLIKKSIYWNFDIWVGDF